MQCFNFGGDRHTFAYRDSKHGVKGLNVLVGTAIDSLKQFLQAIRVTDKLDGSLRTER